MTLRHFVGGSFFHRTNRCFLDCEIGVNESEIGGGNVDVGVIVSDAVDGQGYHFRCNFKVRRLIEGGNAGIPRGHQ